jgi:hypothetical protein
MSTNPNPFETDAVSEMLSPEKNNDYFANFGLNLSRSQSAAPMFSSLSSSVSPPRSGPLANLSSGGGRSESFGEKKKTYDGYVEGSANSFLFGGPSTTTNRSRRHFFSEEDEDDVDFIPGLIKRPASTGGIERHSNNENADVNSILETLGLASLDSADDTSIGVSPRVAARSSVGANTPKKLFEDDSMIRHEGEHVSSSSKASKYFSRDVNEEEEVDAQGQFGYDDHGYGGSGSNGSSHFRGGNVHQQSQQQSMYPQFSQQHQPVGSYNSQHQQHQPVAPYDSHQQPQPFYESQQQVFYNQQQPSAQYLQHQNMNVMQGPQPTLYQINNPGAQTGHQQQFGFDYQQQQQQQQTPQQAHVLLQQGGGMYSHNQPQFISIVPIQTQHHPQIINGHAPAYAYVQYAPDGSMQLHQPQPSAAFIMGPHGQPIALASVPMNVGYSPGHGTSPPDIALGAVSLGSPRTPSRGGMKGGPRTPSASTPNSLDGRKMRGNGLSSPRGSGGKRGDKNIIVPSRMGPVATSLLNEIRAAKSRNQWTIHDIRGHIIEFCLDQNGSRFIQQRLEVADAVEKRAVMDEVVPSMKELLNDVFGNYVIQKLFEFGNEEMTVDLKNTLKGNMLLLSLQMYG